MVMKTFGSVLIVGLVISFKIGMNFVKYSFEYLTACESLGLDLDNSGFKNTLKPSLWNVFFDLINFVILVIFLTINI